jgi:hypothetical protein
MKVRRSAAPLNFPPTHERTFEITLRDVKNEGRPGDVYENTGGSDKMSPEKTGSLQEITPIAR